MFRFAEVTHKYMGERGTHPWVQGLLPKRSSIPGNVTVIGPR
jgi:hypothetical protein